MRPLLAVLLTGVAAFGGGWYLGRIPSGRTLDPTTSDRAVRTSSEPKAEKEELLGRIESSPRQLGVQADISAPALTEPVAISRDPTMEEALEALDRAMQSRPVYEDDDAQFEAKYRNATAEAAQEALKLVSERVRVQESAIISERLASGLYEESIRRPDEPGAKLKGSGKGLSVFGTSKEMLPDGMIRERVTEIPPGEYPEFDANRMEKWYLVRKTRGKLRSSSAATGGGGH